MIIFYTVVHTLTHNHDSCRVNYDGEGKGDGLYWMTTTNSHGEGNGGTRFAGVVEKWFEPRTYVHTVWTASAGNANTFYKNGVAASDGVQTAAPHVDLLETYNIGQIETFFSGTIDDVAFYEFALNASDVAAMNPCTTCTPEDLCKLCPHGYQFDSAANTYEDFDVRTPVNLQTHCHVWVVTFSNRIEFHWSFRNARILTADAIP